MRSILKLFLAAAAILNAAAVFGSGETFSESVGVSTCTPSRLPTYEEMKQNPEHAKEMLIKTARNKKAAFGVRYTAVHRLHYILNQTTEAAQLARGLGLESSLKLNEKVSILNLLNLIKNSQIAAVVASYKGIGLDAKSTIAQKLKAAYLLKELGRTDDAEVIFRAVVADPASRSDEIFEANEEIASLLSCAS
jgi:hypothetical protein